MKLKTYKNSTELANLGGVPIYMQDMADACLRAKLNLFLQGDTGSGKTQLVRDVMQNFGDKSLFILGRNDMDTRELFQQVNPEFLEFLRSGKGNPAKFKELTDKVTYHLIGVDELPNCVPAVRAQLFNLFDGYIEIDGKVYPLGSEYSIGMATGNIGQQFTESSNELGRALKDRMHLTIDTDFFEPKSRDTFEMDNMNPRVSFDEKPDDNLSKIIESHKTLKTAECPLEKRLIKEYLLHGLNYTEKFGSKRAMKSGWPNKIEGNEAGSDEALILPVSVRAGKSIMSLSQALDQIVSEKGGNTDYEDYYFDSMMTAFKFVGAYSGILNEAAVRNNYAENRYKAMDAVIAATALQFKGGENITGKKDALAAVMHMINSGETSQKVLNEFSGRWDFMKDLAEYLAEKKKNEKRQT